MDTIHNPCLEFQRCSNSSLPWRLSGASWCTSPELLWLLPFLLSFSHPSSPTVQHKHTHVCQWQLMAFLLLKTLIAHRAFQGHEAEKKKYFAGELKYTCFAGLWNHTSHKETLPEYQRGYFLSLCMYSTIRQLELCRYRICKKQLKELLTGHFATAYKVWLTAIIVASAPACIQLMKMLGFLKKTCAYSHVCVRLWECICEGECNKESREADEEREYKQQWKMLRRNVMCVSKLESWWNSEGGIVTRLSLSRDRSCCTLHQLLQAKRFSWLHASNED